MKRLTPTEFIQTILNTDSWLLVKDSEIELHVNGDEEVYRGPDPLEADSYEYTNFIKSVNRAIDHRVVELRLGAGNAGQGNSRSLPS
jgi:hypothetical protein